MGEEESRAENREKSRERERTEAICDICIHISTKYTHLCVCMYVCNDHLDVITETTIFLI